MFEPGLYKLIQKSREAASEARPVDRKSRGRVRPFTARDAQQFEDAEFTRPVDYHSFRRSFKQALADAGVGLQQAMALSGASDAKTHQRYLNHTAKMRRVPSAALSSICIPSADSQVTDSTTKLDSSWAGQVSNLSPAEKQPLSMK